MQLFSDTCTIHPKSKGSLIHTTLALIIVLSCFLSGCKESSQQQVPAQKNTPAPKTNINQHQATTLTKALWKNGATLFTKSAELSQAFEASINALLDKPTPEAMQTAQQSWHATMSAIEQCFTYLYLARARPEDFEILYGYWHYLAAWPIQPGYLDAFGSYQYSGIVFDVQLAINEVSLRRQHGLTDPGEVTIGLYAIEFIMAGESHQRSALALTPATEISQINKENGYDKLAELPRNRRRQLLRTQAAMLTKDTQALAELWRADGSDSLQKKMTQFAAQEQIKTFTEAAVYAILEQIKTLSALNQKTLHHQDDNTFHLTGLQQANRLKAQAVGMKQFLALIDKEYPIARDIALIDNVIASLDKVTSQLIAITATSKQEKDPSATPTSQPEINWKDTYRDLKSLAESMLQTQSPATEKSPEKTNHY